MNLLQLLDDFFCRRAPLARGERVLVAFSGGADSTALLWSLQRLARSRRFRVHAAHLDHGLDPDSTRRASAAAAAAERLGVPLAIARRTPERGGAGVEAAARRLRYRFLDEQRRRLGARWIATAHQRDDQLETVCLRLLHGSGVAGLAGIPACRGRIVRPLLGVGRAELERALLAAGVPWIEDPTNDELAVPRNRVRHRLLPELLASAPELADRLLALAAAAAAASASVERRLLARLGGVARTAAGEVGPAVAGLPLEWLRQLPGPLWPFALSLLDRGAELPYPAAASARRELARQAARPGRIACDRGAGWRWRVRGGSLLVERDPSPPPRFTYTVQVPGAVAIREIATVVRVEPAPLEDWMLRGEPRRAGLALRLSAGEAVTVRNRLPGDRVQPLGCAHRRRLKEVLIDRRVPQAERDRLPLVCVGDRIAWVPGVTVDDAFRLRTGEPVWRAELVPLRQSRAPAADPTSVGPQKGTP